MGTAALATRLATPRTKPVRDRTTCGLAFDDLGGPLVAVCGLTGGAGSTTVALALARQSALESRVPVLIAEHGNLCGGLAAAAGQASPLGLAALSGHLDASQPLPGAFVELAPGLRLIAATPTRHQASAAGALDTLLAQARDAHGLVVIDCGIGWDRDDPVLRRATHVLWTMPATATGLARAQMLFASDAVPPAGVTPEALAAVGHRRDGSVRIRALRRLARERCERIVLIAHDRLHTLASTELNDAWLRACTGLAPFLARRRDAR
ncbi:MAG TPA: hypothetical protein VFY36_04660 [Solirubrobacteraceae bacterium]|nr:hypothetical protein [Solirubrobacteraceae bacterium]